MKKSFSLIIPTLNESAYIENLLLDIRNQTLRPKEIKIVDGFSTDNTLKKVKKYPEVKTLSCPPHVASQRNYGAKNSTSDILIFLDADTRLPNNHFFKEVITKFEQQKLAIACPYFFPFQSNPFIFAVYSFFSLMFFLFQKVSPSGAGSALLVKKSTFLKAKGFNQNVKFEDIELIRRIAKTEKFRMLNTFIWVSDRRFKKYGILRTTLKYLLLSFLFLFNKFNYSPAFSYQFGKYNKKSK